MATDPNSEMLRAMEVDEEADEVRLTEDHVALLGEPDPEVLAFVAELSRIAWN